MRLTRYSKVSRHECDWKHNLRALGHGLLFCGLVDVLAYCQSACAVNQRDCVRCLLVDCDWPRASIGIRRLASALAYAIGANCSKNVYASTDRISAAYRRFGNFCQIGIRYCAGNWRSGLLALDR